MGAPAPSTHQPPTPAAPAPLVNSATAAPPALSGAAPLTRAFPLPVPRWVGWATRTLRGQFLLLGLLILCLCLIQAYVMTRTFAQAQADLTTITRSSVPSIEAAQAMAQTLEELDAQAAIYLTSGGLTEPAPCALIGGSASVQPLPPQACAALNLDVGVLLFNRHLYAAAHNVTYLGERTAIERITTGFQDYVGHLTVMRYEYESASALTDLSDPALQRALAAYQSARLVLREQPSRQPSLESMALLAPAEGLVPRCESVDHERTIAASEWPNGALQLNLTCLISLNQTHLQAAYGHAQSYLDTGWYLLLVIEIPLAILLILATLRMIFISRRVFNPGLTLAMVGGLALGFATLATLASLSTSLHDLVRTDYDHLYRTAALKRYATTAYASHSRWLLARQADQPEQAAAALADWDRQMDSLNGQLAFLGTSAPFYSPDIPRGSLQAAWQGYADVRQTSLEELGAMADRAQVQAAMGPALEASDQTFRAFLVEVDTQYRDPFQGSYRLGRQGIEATLEQYRLNTMLFFPLVGLLALWGIALRLRDF